MRVKTEEKRLAILEAAKGVFLERGYMAASMSEVAARVGGSKQTLYSYFASKDELFVAMMLEKGATMIDPLFDRFHDNRDLPAGLNEFAIQFLRFVNDPEIIAFRRIIYAEGAKSNLGKLFFENGPKRGWTRMAADFSRAMDEGRMRRADPWRAVGHFFALCEAGPVQRLIEGAADSIDEAELVASAEAAADVFCRAYALEDESSPDR
ncbi:TetR/AcrR family transcriptional regulator [Caulobacter sp. BK020]|uniref:TetR/AcrR family transcriptional regulator n=1 Tax=Caulobacter sp. BK020 TaxID=2512117 RepID=UPI00104632A3|nr:TetR/AcrR family transcriptional regulator [Caulobacter sp. BK020]TCS17478.1 TetR family transcriptional regulator [Caulobacter sp. BK020]